MHYFVINNPIKAKMDDFSKDDCYGVLYEYQSGTSNDGRYSVNEKRRRSNTYNENDPSSSVSDDYISFKSGYGPEDMKL